MSRESLTPIKVAQLPTLPSGGANTRGLFAVGAHVYFDDGASVLQLDQQAGAAPALRTVTSSTTLVLGDALLSVNAASAATVTVPPNSSVAFATPKIINVFARGAGQVTIAAGSGVTVLNANGVTKLRRQGSVATLTQLANDVWLLVGDMEPVYFKGYGEGVSGAAYTTVTGNGFNRIPIPNVESALGGMSLDGSQNVVIPTPGRYDIQMAVRVVDDAPPRSLGLGVNTVQGDSPQFYWGQNFNEFSPTQDRFTFQYNNTLTFAAGDLVRPFAYSEDGGGGFPVNALNLVLKLTA